MAGAIIIAPVAITEIAMDRQRALLIGSAVALILFLAYLLGFSGGTLPH
jgi:hypothetical protein